MINLAILGASGSIGRQTINIVKENKDKFSIKAVSVHSNVNYLQELLTTFPSIQYVSLKKSPVVDSLKLLYPNITFFTNDTDGLINLVRLEEVDLVVNALVGFVGLEPTIEALEHKKNVALANKETLVVAGHIIKDLLKKNDVKIFPIDSEHSAIWQCLQGEKHDQISKLILTCSGGSFRNKTRSQLKNVTVEEALNHPNWSMGKKITIDSATLVNKGLEVIEAHYLFDIDYDNIEVVIHQESIIHSMVEFCDGSIKAQMGVPSMEIPIQYALSYPDRLYKRNDHLDFSKLKKLSFDVVDYQRFPALKLAYEAGKKGNSYPCVFNAANEVAVNEFLMGNIKFLTIDDVIKSVIDDHKMIENPTLEQIVEIDSLARQKALQACKNGGKL